MVALTPIKDYSPQQIKAARELSPALNRYLQLLEKKPSDDLSRWRQVRHQSWCEAVLATIYQTASCSDVCRSWTADSEALLKEIWNSCGLDQENCILVAMGKFGAQELNLSSDIDLIFVSQDEPSAELNKKVRQWIRMVSSVTDFGFCYRVDLDLRPGGKSSPLVTSWDHFTNHYGYAGETWERVAMVRLRVLWGNEHLTTQVESFCSKFAYRKHIDLRLFNDLYLMRERIQQNIVEKTLNLKYWPGGIRDLELFVHSLQLINGGKKVSLKTVSTTTAIEEIQKLNLIPSADANLLLTAYWYYRTIENKVHAYGDQHTYELSLIEGLISQGEIDQFQIFAKDVEKLLNDFLLPHKPKSSLVSDKDLKAISETMAGEMGLDPVSLDELLTQDVRSRTYERDENERRHFLKTSILLLKKQGDSASLALRHLTTFINNIRAKTSLYSLFNTHPQLIEEILWIFSTSPYLSQILIHRPDLVDSYIMKSADIDRSDDASFFKSIYDLKLVAELTAASAFLRNRNLSALTENLSRTADVIAQNTLDYFLKKFPQIHIDILTMGKWAGLEMGLKSDLDFIFITDTEPGTDHMKLARRFVHALQTPPSQPQIYSIDLRLRPSGSSGPLLSQMSQVKKYLAEKAMIWERQAYLRARLLSSSQDLQLFAARPMTAEEKVELQAIQQKLLMPISENIDFKKTHGGLISTEFTVQLALLDQQKFSISSHFPNMIHAATGDSTLAQKILTNYTTLRTYHQLLILIADSPETSLQLNAPSFIKLASHLKTSPGDLFQQIVTLLKNQDSLLKGLDPLS